MAVFDASSTRKETPSLRGALPPPALGWIDATFADADYAALRGLRNKLTHGRVTRHFRMPRERLRLRGDGADLSVPQWLELTERFVFNRLEALTAVLPSI